MTMGKRRGTEYDSHIGSQIRHIRMTAGVSQEQLGKALGVTFQQIQKYESGANRISAGRLFVLAKRLGAQVTDFYDGLETTVRPRGRDDEGMSQVAKFIRTRQGMRLNLAFLRPENRSIRKHVINLLLADAADQ